MFPSTDFLLIEMKLIRERLAGLKNRRGIMNCEKPVHEQKITGLEQKYLEVTMELKRRGLKVIRKRKKHGDGQNRTLY
jgi:hypothetical protein